MILAASRCESLGFMKARYRRSNLARQLAERPGCLIASFPLLTARQVRNVKSGFRSLISACALANEGTGRTDNEKARRFCRRADTEAASRGTRLLACSLQALQIVPEVIPVVADLFDKTGALAITSSRISGETAFVVEKLWETIPIAGDPSTF